MQISFRKVIDLIGYVDRIFTYAWIVILAWFIINFPFNNPIGRYSYSGAHALTYILFLSIGAYFSFRHKSFVIGVFAMLTLIFLHELIFNIGFLGVYWHYLVTPSYIYFLTNSIPFMLILGFPLIFREFRILLKNCVIFLIQNPFFIGYFSFWLFYGLPISLNVFIPHYINTNPRANVIEIGYSFSFVINLIPIILKWRFS